MLLVEPDDAATHTDSRTGDTTRVGSNPDIGPQDSLLPPSIAGYDLVRILGRGGMGVVWEAVEHRLARHVALKIHSSSAPESGPIGGQLWNEALVAARIGDPSIVSVLDVGFTVDGRPFYTMDLVHGVDLAGVIADGPMPPRKAVSIAADMARAAAAAHQRGITHRDLKPRNVIVDSTGRARVVDFGIALDAKGGVDRFEGLLAGTPPYMAPEQITTGPIGPATDIWAIGVILHEMLTGERPFVGATVEALFGAILSAEPRPPSSRREGIHADLDAVVARCLMKDTAARFASAGALFETLSALVEGQRVPSASGAQPVVLYVPKGTRSASWRPVREEAKKHLSWSWKLASPPEALWPYIADTDAFNKAVGLGPVAFTDTLQPNGVVKRTGELRVLGMQVTWRELPFEWIKGREHAVFRSYEAGPIATLWNRVTLVPDGAGTELRHEIWASPRGVVGHVAAFVELDRKLAPAIDRVYRQIDAVLSSGRANPFEPAHVPTSEQTSLVEAASRRLRGMGFEATLVDKLAHHLLTSPDGAIRALRPYELADRWGTDRDETLDAFIHAAQANVLEPAWDLICPTCRIAHESLGRLANLKRQGTCTACAASFERDLSYGVELVFLPHPSVRKVELATYCAGAPARRPHIVAQQLLDPGEERTFKVDLRRGSYVVASSVTRASSEIVASAVGFEERCEVAISADGVAIGPEVLKAGEVRFTVRNASPVEQAVRVELAGARDDVVSAAAALTHPSFRSYFSGELLAEGEHVRVQHLAFLFVELRAWAELFEMVGDGVICGENARLDSVVAEEVRRHEGTLLPWGMHVVAAAFPTPLRALRAALALRRLVSEPKAFSAPVSIAVHGGRCIALTRAGRPEFFGETLHRGHALLAECPVNGIALSPTMMADHVVAITAHESKLSVVAGKTLDGPYRGRRVTYLVPIT
jgi:serine/threonine protein kinase